MSEARIVITADAGKAVSEIDRLKGAFSNGMKSVESSAAFATKAVGLLAAGGLALSFANNIKQAIDLADSLNKLSQRTGVSVESLSQLQYAAKLADVSSDSLTISLKKLNVSIAQGVAGDKEKVATFKALGITLTDTAGRTKSADQVLLDLADTFAKSKDGAGKTAAAVALLGRAGDEMIPLLNGGKQAILALMNEAAKLGLTIGTDFAAQAEEFNDNLTRIQTSSQRLSIALAGDLVSGLGRAMKAMADAAVQGGALRGVIAGIQTLLTGDDLHKANVATVKGTELVMAAEAALTKARVSGDVARVDRLTKALELRKQELATDSNYRKMLEGDEAKALASAAALQKLRTNGAEIKAPSAGGSGGGSRAEKIDPQIKAYEQLIASIKEKISVNEEELKLGRKLTESEKQFFDIQKLVEKSTISAKDASSEEIKVMLARMAVNEQALKAEAALLKYIEEGDAAKLKSLLAGDETIQQLADQNKAMRDEIEMIGLSDRAQFDLNQTRNESLILMKTTRLERLQSLDIGRDEQEQLKEEIRLRKEGASLQGTKFERAEEFKKLDELGKQSKQFTDDLERGLTDSLYRAFESGKGFFKTLWDGIKNLFKTTALKLIVNAVVGGVGGGAGGLASAASSLFGGGGAAGGGLGSLGQIGQLATSLTGAATAFTGAFSSGLALGTEAFSAGVSMMSTATGATSFAAGAGQAIGAIAPVLGPLVLAAGILIKGFAKGPRVVLDSGVRGTFNGDGFQGTNYESFEQKNGFLRGDNRGTTDSAIDPAVAKQFTDTMRTTRDSVALFAKGIGASTDILAQYRKEFTQNKGQEGIDKLFGDMGEEMSRMIITGRTNFSGAFDQAFYVKENMPERAASDAKATAENDRLIAEIKAQGLSRADEADAVFALRKDFVEQSQRNAEIYSSFRFGNATGDQKRGMATDDVQVGEDNSRFMRAGETAVQTLARLGVSISAVNAVFGTLGSKLLDISIVSADAASKLVDAFGGVENLTKVSQAYYDNFYSEEEKRAKLQGQLNSAFSSIGVALPSDRTAFRAEVDKASSAIDTDEGRARYAGLLNLAPLFAQFNPVVEATAIAVAGLTDRMRDLLKERGSLEADLLQAQGDTTGATAARRALATVDFSAVEVAAYDYNRALIAQTQTLLDASAAAAAVATERAGLQDQLAILTGAQTQRSISLRDATDETTRALLVQIYAQQDLNLAATELAAAIVTAAEKARVAAAERLSAVTSGASDAFGGLTRAVEAQKADELKAYNIAKQAAEVIFKAQLSSAQAVADGVKKSLATIGESLGKLKSLAGSLKSTLDGLRIIGSEEAYRTDAQAKIKAALATARSGGGLPLDGQLASALSTISKPSEELFSSFSDYASDFFKTANDIAELSKLTDAQITADEITQAILQGQSDKQQEQIELLKNGFSDQVSTLDGILENAKNQLDMASGINTSVLSVGAALTIFNTSIGALISERTKQNLPTTSASGMLSSAAGSYTANSADGAAGQFVTGLYASIAGKGPGEIDQQGYNYWLSQVKAVGESQVQTDFGNTVKSIRGFAVGTNYVPRDMLAQIHEGEAIVPKAYNPAANGGGANTARLESLVEKLTEEVKALKALQAENNADTRQHAQQFDAVSAGGNALVTMAA